MKDVVLHSVPWLVVARASWKLPDWVEKWLDVRDRLRRPPAEY